MILKNIFFSIITDIDHIYTSGEQDGCMQES